MTTTEISRKEMARQIQELGPWFHNMELCGIQTAPEHFLGDYPRIKYESFANALPHDLSGKSVLDIGCNGGFYSIEMKRRGASRVVGIDHDDRYLAQARFAAASCETEIEFRKLSVYDVAQLRERFDVVLFMGVLYHLRHPLLALDLLHQHVVNDVFVFQSLQRGSKDVADLEPDYPFSEQHIFEQPGFPKMYFIEKEYSHDWTNWWIPNRACVEAMLRSSGFEIIDNPEAEVYLCRRLELPNGGYSLG